MGKYNRTNPGPPNLQNLKDVDRILSATHVRSADVQEQEKAEFERIKQETLQRLEEIRTTYNLQIDADKFTPDFVLKGIRAYERGKIWQLFEAPDKSRKPPALEELKSLQKNLAILTGEEKIVIISKEAPLPDVLRDDAALQEEEALPKAPGLPKKFLPLSKAQEMIQGKSAEDAIYILLQAAKRVPRRLLDDRRYSNPNRPRLTKFEPVSRQQLGVLFMALRDIPGALHQFVTTYKFTSADVETFEQEAQALSALFPPEDQERRRDEEG